MSDTDIVMKKVEELKRRKAELALGGGADKIQKQHQEGKLTARERLDRFFDKGSFMEIDGFGKSMGKDFGMDKVSVPSDGVVIGLGKVDGRNVAAFAQDFTSMAGTMGEMHGKKIVKISKMAAELGVPVVGIHESGGARLQEFLAISREYGLWFYLTCINSGVIPQISAMLGAVAGGQAYQPGLSDFIFMRKDSAAFIAGPPLVESMIGEKISAEDLGGARIHATTSGVCHYVAQTDEECIDAIRDLLSYLPSNNREKPPFVPNDDPVDRVSEKLYDIAADATSKPYDMHKVIKEIADKGKFLEIHKDFQKNMIVGFARFGGHSAGIVANNPMYMSGAITCEAAEKAARFITFCDAFNVPLIYLVSTPAYMVGSQQERKGMIYRGATLLHATSVATVPKITIEVGWAYAGAYVAMGSKYLGADLVYGWPTAEIGLVAAEGVVNLIFRKEIASAADPAAERKKREEEFRKTYMSIYYPASYQHIDDIIDPKETRSVIIKSLEALKGKKLELPWKKHGNPPL